MGTHNATGITYRGHYDIWTTNELQETITAAQQFVSDCATISGWVNGNLYQPSGECFGIIPIPDTICRDAGLSSYSPLSGSKRQHDFLAKRQGTYLAVLPLHTKTEFLAFGQIMKNPQFFTSPAGKPIWPNILQFWNHTAERTPDMFYKVPNSPHLIFNKLIFVKLQEHLVSYFDGAWQTKINHRTTLHMSIAPRQELNTKLLDKGRASNISLTTSQPRFKHQAPKGVLSLDSPNTVPDTGTSSPPVASTSGTPHTQGSSSTSQASTSQLQPRPLLEQLALKRAQALNDPKSAPPRKKKTRKCMKCLSTECPGRGGRHLCKSRCSDCKRGDCNGRIEKYGELPCPNARNT